MKKQHKLILICSCGLILAIFMNCFSKASNTKTGTPLFIGSGDTGGTLTVTDIPSEYNGRYALFDANSGNVTYIRGYQSVDESTETTTLPQISNGRVSIPLWLWINNESANSFYLKSKYTGNDTISREDWDFRFIILGSGILSPLSLPALLARIEFTSITFSNGSATISANTGSLEIPQR